MSYKTLMSTAQVAELLELSTRQIARMVEIGQLEAAGKAPGIRGAYLFDRDAIAVVYAQRNIDRIFDREAS